MRQKRHVFFEARAALTHAQLTSFADLTNILFILQVTFYKQTRFFEQHALFLPHSMLTGIFTEKFANTTGHFYEP